MSDNIELDTEELSWIEYVQALDILENERYLVSLMVTDTQLED